MDSIGIAEDSKPESIYEINAELGKILEEDESKEFKLLIKAYRKYILTLVVGEYVDMRYLMSKTPTDTLLKDISGERKDILATLPEKVEYVSTTPKTYYYNNQHTYQVNKLYVSTTMKRRGNSGAMYPCLSEIRPAGFTTFNHIETTLDGTSYNSAPAEYSGDMVGKTGNVMMAPLSIEAAKKWKGPTTQFDGLTMALIKFPLHCPVRKEFVT